MPDSEAAAPIPLLVVDDEPFFRELVTNTLARQPTLRVVGSFADAAEALAAPLELEPRVALLDLDLGDGPDGVALGLALQAQWPGLQVVLLSSVNTQAYANFLRHPNTAAWSSLHKRNLGNVEALVLGLRTVASGLQVTEPALPKQPPNLLQGGPLGHLSDRDAEMLRLLAQGVSNQVLASHFQLSEKTVEGLLAQLYRKLNINTKDPSIHPRVRAGWLHQQAL